MLIKVKNVHNIKDRSTYAVPLLFFSLFSDVTFNFYSIFVTYRYILNNILVLLILGLLVLDIIYYLPILVDENVPQLSYSVSPVRHIFT